MEPLSLDEATARGLDYWFDPERATHAIDFFQGWLRHSAGRFAGQPFTLLPWQAAMIAELFGWVRVSDGTRRYRVAYISTGKKQGKSTLLAGIGLYLLVADGENGAEIYGAACDREQASVVYREAANMVRASPQLSRVLEVVDSRRTIAYRRQASFYRVLSADAHRAEGLNIHGLLFDELHAQRDRRLWDALRYGGAARAQPLIVSITTAGFDRNSICYEQYSYAKQVQADWKFDPTFFSLVYEPDAEDDWTAPETWPKANPSWGVTIDPTDFAAEVREAQANVRKQASFQRYRLNTWTQANTRWLSPDAWATAALPPPAPLDGRECWIGLDLAYSADTTAAVAVFPSPDGSLDVLPRFYLPSDGMAEREKRDGMPYSQWVAEGYVVLTPGETTDYDFVRRDIEAMTKRYRIRRIAIDPWQAIQLGNQLQGMGLDVYKYPQGYRGFNSPCRQLETLLANGKLRHGGNPVLASHAGNVTIRQNAEGMIRPLKPSDNNNARVDGIIALLQALGAWSAEEQKPQKPLPQIHVL